ncbi:hypothetical protein [Amycolatopsis sp. CA-126428]|uniref:hypothetical protein n=1 Tax=Amycolatopsis sp. CA-126428 TaxID=2073158 RepID=UPI0011B0A577|nr:hypothetical protein [Amycolatopsis sp. CA-126428]
MGVHERRCDRSGHEHRASPAPARTVPALLRLQSLAGNRAVAGVVQRAVTAGKFNIVGEHHDESMAREPAERQYAKKEFALEYWDEKGFVHDDVRGDDFVLSAIQDVGFVYTLARHAQAVAEHVLQMSPTGEELTERVAAIDRMVRKCADFAMDLYNTRNEIHAVEPEFADLCKPLPGLANALKNATVPLRWESPGDTAAKLENLVMKVPELMQRAELAVRAVKGPRSVLDHDSSEEPDGDSGEEKEPTDPWEVLEGNASIFQAQHMFETACDAASAGVTALWKVGDSHVEEMRWMISEDELQAQEDVVLTNRREFNDKFIPWQEKKREKRREKNRRRGSAS